MTRPPAPHILKILDAVQAIDEQPNPSDADRAFLARQLVQVTLPHSNPGDVPIWTRTNGNLTLSIRPGWDHENKKPLAYPFGTVPRLLLFWITTEAVRAKSPRLELGDSLSDFMREIGLNPDNGGTGAKRSDANRFRKQMESLFRATISFEQSSKNATQTGKRWLDMQVAPTGEFWWDPKFPEQPTLWGSWIQLGEGFFDALVNSPVPLDLRALRALKNSPLALDLYAWAAYRTYVVTKKDKPAFVPWRSLMTQLGCTYGRVDNFRAKAREAIIKVEQVYPHFSAVEERGGIKIFPSKTPIPTLPKT